MVNSPRSERSKGDAAGKDEEEDDYMSMSFSEPQAHSTLETSIQRRARKQREAELRARPKSKAERDAEEAAAREAALSTSLDSTNKGFQMMWKLGFKGGALGKKKSSSDDDAGDGGGKGAAAVRTEPVSLVVKEDRGGIGMDSEKKRKFREQVEGEAKRVKADEGEYRERLVREREEKRIEGQIIGAMVVAEGLDEEAQAGGRTTLEETSIEQGSSTEENDQKASPPAKASKPLSKINVLWRSLVKHRLEKERERRMRYDLHQSLSRLPTYEDDDDDDDDEDEQAFSKQEEEIEEEDAELDEFLALEQKVRLEKLVDYLRSTFRYCFWCKFRYPDEGMEGCPGFTEEDHD